MKRSLAKPAHLRLHVMNEHGWLLGDASDEDMVKHHDAMHEKNQPAPPYGFGPANHVHTKER